MLHSGRVPVPSASQVASHGSASKLIAVGSACPEKRYHRGDGTASISPLPALHIRFHREALAGVCQYFSGQSACVCKGGWGRVQRCQG